MPENIRNIIYRFSQELRRILGDKLTKIIVYGSYARGDFRENSDIDIMILVKMSDEEIRLVKNDIYDLAFEFEINTGIEFSPIIKMKTSMSIGLIRYLFTEMCEMRG